MSHDHEHGSHDHHDHGAHEHHHHEPPAGATNLVTCPVMPGNQVAPAWAEQRGVLGEGFLPRVARHLRLVGDAVHQIIYY